MKMKGRLEVATPAAYIAALAEPRRSEIARLHALITKTCPALDPHIRSGMIGYGTYHYTYATGREGDWFRIGLASNASYISLYACASDARGYVAERYKTKLPKASIGKSCVRFKRIDDLSLPVLISLLREAAGPAYAVVDMRADKAKKAPAKKAPAKKAPAKKAPAKKAPQSSTKALRRSSARSH
jgi:hypothetical protein